METGLYERDIDVIKLYEYVHLLKPFLNFIRYFRVHSLTGELNLFGGKDEGSSDYGK
jgi:hypothetical protein